MERMRAQAPTELAPPESGIRALGLCSACHLRATQSEEADSLCAQCEEALGLPGQGRSQPLLSASSSGNTPDLAGRSAQPGNPRDLVPLRPDPASLSWVELFKGIHAFVQMQAAPRPDPYVPADPAPGPSKPRHGHSPPGSPIYRDSDCSEEEGELPEHGEPPSENEPYRTMRRFFIKEDLPDLVFQCLSELAIPGQGTPGEPRMNPLLEGLRQTTHHFPLLQAAQQLIDLEWNAPEASFKGGRALSGMYPLDPATKELLACPRVDAIVCAMVKRTAIPVEGGAALRDAHDRRLDAILRQAFEVAAMSLRIAICCTVVMRSCLSQARNNTPGEEMESALSFLTDTASDLVRTATKGVSLSVAARAYKSTSMRGSMQGKISNINHHGRSS
ncbi:uncharacterized protein LOC115100835 [Rhinatrema bivittatum]|uniref:uncharacterized protein LOC115100835 n=1 Tax=Rhinatrema bivittatum TaxID=194408 RepID=UPI00112C9214|nr:uncharacterized protein LOC115100835 [Rhinatrema bivittatum]